MNMLYVIWHKNPDTDAVLSAMVYAKFLQTQGIEATPVKLWELNNETVYALNYIGRSSPELVTSLPAGTQVVLTDHNEYAQSIDNLADLQVTAIIDHHRFVHNTSEPIEIIVKPIASTCSVIYWLWTNAGKDIPVDVAKAMMMGIISDTLYFRSPTTTQYDKDIFAQLQKIAQLENAEQLSLDMFAAKSDLGDIAVRNLVTLDYKIFETNGKKAWVGTIETTNPSYALSRKEEIIADMKKLKEEEKLDLIMVSVVDILQEKNLTIIASDEDAAIVKTIFAADTVDGLADLWNRISRKKQIAWPLTEYFAW